MHTITDGEKRHYGCEYCIDKPEKSRICPHDHCPYTVLNNYKNYAAYCREAEIALAEMLKRAERPSTQGAKNYRARRVRCVETGVVYGSIADAAAAIGGKAGAVHSALSGRTKTSGGYHWEYIDL